MSATVGSAPGEGAAKPQPGDAAHGTLMLEHAYQIEHRLGTGPFFATYAARQTPFGRAVHVRFYGGLEDLGLAPDDRARLGALIERGGDGSLAVDVGELESGAPFLVIEPPGGQPLTEWWTSGGRSAQRTAAVLEALRRCLVSLTVAQRRELELERLYLESGDEGSVPRLQLYALGDHPTRAEVRRMSGLVTPELARAFPPECFRPARADAEGLEDTEVAEAWRVGAVVFCLLSGDHPLFADGADVAERVAGLVGGLVEGPSPPASGDRRLDEALLAALQLDPEARAAPARLWEAAQAVLEGVEKAAPAAPAAALEATLRLGPSGMPRPFRLVVAAMVLVAVAVATYLLSNRPPSSAAVVLTSEPSGVRFERLSTEGEVEDLGRTPLLLEDEPFDGSLSIRPVYEDGQVGALQTLAPERLELFEACRRLHVQFEEPSSRE